MIAAFIKDGVIYAIPHLLSRSITILLLPIYTRYLTPQEYGLVEILAILFVLLNITIPLEISQAIARLIPVAKQIKEKEDLISSAFWFTFVGFSVITLIVWMFTPKICTVLFNSNKYIFELRVWSLGMTVNSLLFLVQNNLRWCLQSVDSAVTGFMYSLGVVFVSIYLVVVMRLGVLGVLLGQLFGSIMGLAAGLYFAKNSIRILLRINLYKVKEMLIFSSPLVLSSLAVYTNTFADRWFLKLLRDIGDVGIYSVALKIALIPGLIIYLFQMSLVPHVYHNYEKTETPLNIARILNYLFLVVLPILATLIVFGENIIHLMAGEAFYNASEVLLLLSFSVLIMNLYIFSPGLSISKLTFKIAVINIFASITNVILNIILIPKLGISGAAYATLFGSIAMAALYYYWGNKEYKIPYDYANILISLIILSVFILINRIYMFNFIESLLFLIAFTICLFILLLSAKEKKAIFNTLSNIGLARK